MADLEITVGLNDRASRQLQNIDKAASSLTRTLRGAGAAAVAFASGSVVTGVVNQYRAFEKYRSVLTTYLGSQTKANAELKRLQGLANSLPQDLADVTEAFTIFSRFGLDTSSEALTAFSNIATANGKSFAQLGEAVADALTGEFERLKEFGIKVSKENDQFVARIGNQQVALANSTTDLVAQLQTLGEEGGRFGSAASDNADTLNQSISNLQGALFEASVTIGEQLKPALKEAADEMARFVRDNEKLQENLGAGLGEAIKLTSSSVKLLADNIELVRNAALAYLGLRFANAFVNLSTKLSGAIKRQQDLNGMMETFKKVVRNNMPILSKFATGLRTIGTYAIRLAPLLTNPFTAVVAVIGAAVAGGLYFFQDSMVKVGETAATLKEVVKASFQVMGDAATYVGTWIKDKFLQAVQAVKEYFVSLQEPVLDVVNSIGRFFQEAFSYVSDVVSAAVNQVRDYISSVSTPVQAAVQRVVDGFKVAFNYVVNIVVATFTQIKSIISQLPTFFIGAFKGVLSVADSFGEAVVKKFSNIFEAIKLAGSFEFQAAFDKLGEDTGFSMAESFKKGFQDSGIDLIDTSDIFEVDRFSQVETAVKNTYGAAATYISGTVLPAFEGVKGSVIETATAVGETLGDAYDFTTGKIEEKVIANRAEQEQMEAVAKAVQDEITVMEQAVLTSDNLVAATDAVSESQTNLAGSTNQAKTQLTDYQRYLNNLLASATTAANQTTFAKQAQIDLNEQFRMGKITAAQYSEAMERINSTLGIVKKTSSSTAAAVNKSNKTIEKETKTIADTIGEKMMGLSSSISSTMTDVFLGLKGGFEGLEDIALSVVKTIVNTLVQEFLVKPLLTNISKAIGSAFGGIGGGMGGGLFGGGGGLLGGLFSMFTGGFGGGLLSLFGFADGGNTAIAGQKPILVGERGPEIFMPGKAGTVVSNEDLQGMGGNDSLVVNFNLNAVDTQSGVEFLLQNKQVITGVVQDAYRRRGQQGPLG